MKRKALSASYTFICSLHLFQHLHNSLSTQWMLVVVVSYMLNILMEFAEKEMTVHSLLNLYSNHFVFLKVKKMWSHLLNPRSYEFWIKYQNSLINKLSKKVQIRLTFIKVVSYEWCILIHWWITVKPVFWKLCSW